MTHKLRIVLFVGFFFSLIYPFAWGKEFHGVLKFRGTGSGSFEILNGRSLLAIVEPEISLLGTDVPSTFMAIDKIKGNKIHGSSNLFLNAKVDLSGNISSNEKGISVIYELEPDRSITVTGVYASIKFPVPLWMGAKYQVGMWQDTITSHLVPFFKSPQQSLVMIGPSEKDGIYFEINGEDRLTPVQFDDRSKGSNVLEFRLDIVPTKDPIKWSKGQKKRIVFELFSNGSFDPNIDPLDDPSYGDEKSKILNGPVINSVNRDNDVDNKNPKISKVPSYEIPTDSKMVRYLKDDFFGPHIFVPVELNIQTKEYTGWLLWDSGTRPKNVDMNISSDFFEKLGLGPNRERETSATIPDSEKGNVKKERFKFHFISNGSKSDVGPVPVTGKVGDMSFENLSLYTNPQLDNSVALPYNQNDPKFRDSKVIGVFPVSLMLKSLTSIDYKNELIYFRPLDSKIRYFFKDPPLEKINFLLTDGIYFKTLINDQIQGMGLFDTGGQANTLDLSKVEIGAFPINSLRIDRHDVLNNGSNSFPVFMKSLKGITSSDDLDALIGNEAFEGKFITIDPVNKQIYVEKN